MTCPKLVRCSNFASKVHLPRVFPKAVLPKGDQIGFLREEPRVLQLCLIVFVLLFDKLVVLHMWDFFLW